MATAVVNDIDVDGSEHDGEFIDHICCCANDKVALCGEDLSDVEFLPPDAPVDKICPGCDYIDTRLVDCPFGGRCPR